MPYIAPEVITEAKRMDLLTYLREYEPNELVKYSNNTYTTRTHDSLKISNGKWMWWSRGIGGKSALDYLIKVRGMDFVEAVQTIMGNSSVRSPIPENTKSYNNQPLLLPERSPTTDVVFEYLFGRGIDYEIINYCLEKELVIESLPYQDVYKRQVLTCTLMCRWQSETILICVLIQLNKSARKNAFAEIQKQ